MQHRTCNTTQSQRVGGGSIQRSPLSLNLNQPLRLRPLTIAVCLGPRAKPSRGSSDAGSDHRDRERQNLEARGCQGGCVAYWARSHLLCFAFPPPNPSFAFFLLQIRSFKLPGWSLG